jgi:hypothetical protein
VVLSISCPVWRGHISKLRSGKTSFPIAENSNIPALKIGTRFPHITQYIVSIFNQTHHMLLFVVGAP